MARRGRTKKTRTRTITKFKTRRVFSGMRSRGRSFRSRHSGKVDHVVAITAGAGAGALTTTLLQLLAKNGIKIPSWLPLALSGATGLLVGKHIGKSWTKGAESAIASVATSYIETNGLNLNLGVIGQGSQNIGGQVY